MFKKFNNKKAEYMMSGCLNPGAKELAVLCTSENCHEQDDFDLA